MDLASVVAALASVGVPVSGSAPNSSVQVDSSRACPPGLAGPEPSGTINDLEQHFHPLAHVAGAPVVPTRRRPLRPCGGGLGGPQSEGVPLAHAVGPRWSQSERGPLAHAAGA